MSIFKYHDRSTSPLKLNQTVSRRNNYLARRSKGVDGSSSGSDDKLAMDDKGSRPCELAVKLPLWDMLFDMSKPILSEHYIVTEICINAWWW